MADNHIARRAEPPSADYRLDVTIRNNRVLHYMQQMGYRTAAELSRAANLDPGTVGEIINLKRAAVTKRGGWSVPAMRIADVLACEPGDLWTDVQRETALKTNRSAVELSERQAEELLASSDPYEVVMIEDRNSHIQEALDALRPREADVLRMHFGLAPYYREHTLQAIGEKYGVNAQTIRHVEAKALRQLRHPGSKAADLSPAEDYK